jgi:uncharacterized protein with PIN domain
MKPIEQAWQKPALDELEKDKKLVDWAFKEMKRTISKDQIKIAFTIDEVLNLAKTSAVCAYCGDSLDYTKKPMLINIEPTKELVISNACVVCDGCRDSFKVFSLSQAKEMQSRRQGGN